MTRFCKAGEQLLKETNREYPDRPKGVDDGEGIFGDPRHSFLESDHNPNDYDVVTAWDIAKASFVDQFVNLLKESKDPRLKYIIWQHHIWSLARDSEGWREYDGDDPHTGHAHVSFSASPKQFDRTDPWNIFVKETDGDMTPEQAKQLDRIEKALERLMAERRTDHKDVNKHELVLSDVLNTIEANK